MFNETIDTMIDHSDKKLDYALRAIQHPQLRETDEFLQWIGIPENKELFLELMACKEAVRICNGNASTERKCVSWQLLLLLQLS